MKGRMSIILPEGSVKVNDYHNRVPDLDEMQRAVNGYIEHIPSFDEYEGEPCVAYCNEEGKLNGMSINHDATHLWFAMNRGVLDDMLVGPVIVLQGDTEFMAKM